MFMDVNIPEGTQQVILTGNRFVDFVGFKPVDSIESLNLDKCPILSFRGFPMMPNLRSLSMIGTPIAGLRNFRVHALACCGPKLRFINGTEVTSNEKSAAAAFGDEKLSHDLLIRGWIPKKPIAIQPDRPTDLTKPKGKKAAPQALPAKQRVEKIVAAQDGDPVSVRAVRVLRAQGMDTSQIRLFLRKHFAPTKEKDDSGKAAKYKKKQESAIEAQIQHQQELINVMAAQLQALRTGNRTFNEYSEMIQSAGRALIENAEFLAKLEGKTGDDQEKNRKAFKPDYALLRAAILEFLEADVSTSDRELINAMNEIADSYDELEDEPVEQESDSDSSNFELESQHEDVSDKKEEVPDVKESSSSSSEDEIAAKPEEKATDLENVSDPSESDKSKDEDEPDQEPVVQEQEVPAEEEHQSSSHGSTKRRDSSDSKDSDKHQSSEEEETVAAENPPIQSMEAPVEEQSSSSEKSEKKSSESGHAQNEPQEIVQESKPIEPEISDDPEPQPHQEDQPEPEPKADSDESPSVEEFTLSSEKSSEEEEVTQKKASDSEEKSSSEDEAPTKAVSTETPTEEQPNASSDGEDAQDSDIQAKEEKVEIHDDGIPRSQRLPLPTSPMGRRGSPGRRRPTVLHDIK